MKVSLAWLKEWVTPLVSSEKLATLLTMNGLEVDQIYPVAGHFDGVVVAKVIDTKPHPEADKLTLCQVDVGGTEYLPIVCGAKNVRPGLKVALAMVGATLPNDFKIKPAKLRGETSMGMLCSAEELGMTATSEGILELDVHAPVGANLRDYLLLDDVVFDIDLTPNRGDCLSISGIAREVSATLNLPIHAPQLLIPEESSSEKRHIEIQAHEACPLYFGRMICGLNYHIETPFWMKERLRRVGIRPLNLVVDVTQYVMWELGQPMHAFNADRFTDDIIVRYAKEGEKIILLDEQEVCLTTDTLVIADAIKPVAIAGVMGGIDTAVSETTQNIWLESAFFTPSALIGKARSYGLMTDASYRYERGVDPVLAERALLRATQLLVEIAGGKPGPICQAKTASSYLHPKKVIFHPDSVSRLIGMEVPYERMMQILSLLGFEIHKQTEKHPETWVIEVPSYRFDITIEADIIEEIVRIQGYDNLPAIRVPVIPTVGFVPPLMQIEREAIKLLSSFGYHQCVTYSFVDAELQQLLSPHLEALSLANPLSSELSEMRTSLLPGLVASMVYNLNRQHDTIALFESGKVFRTEDASSTKEIMMLGAVLTGKHGMFDFNQAPHVFNFYDLKGHIETLFKQFNIDHVMFRPMMHPAMHPAKSAGLFIGEQQIGYCGALHPKIEQMLDISTEVYLFECELASFLIRQKNTYQPVSKYPKIKRDLALIADRHLPFSEIEAAINAVECEHISKTIHVFDVYTGSPIPEDKKSIAVTLFIQSQVKTLNDKEINDYLSAIIKRLETDLSITLRDGTT